MNTNMQNLLEFVTVSDISTPTQLHYLEAVVRYGTISKAAKQLDVSRGTIGNSIDTLRRKAARQGYSPEHDMIKVVPPGYFVKGVSTYYGADGQVAGQWVKSHIDAAQQEAILRAAAAAMAEELPRQAPISAPGITIPDLANVYTLTDAHVGALAWRVENMDKNGDWDLSIAERVLAGCFEHMVNGSAAATTGIVAQLGDFLHFDGLQALTPTSGHILDADGRFPKVVAVAIKILRRVVNLVLSRHEKVLLLLAEGNHDMASSVWLRAMFGALYENEPRVQVIDTAAPYYALQHGNTMLCWHHGHLAKNGSLPLLFAAQFPKMWGDTTKRYCHVGHKHHVEIKEHSGMTVEQHPTLAARDAHAARGGWFSERQCTAITYHKEFGQVARNIITPEMLGK